MMYFKENFDELIERHQKISDPSYEGVLPLVYDVAEVKDRVDIPAVKPLKEWNFDNELYDFLDAVMAREEAIWSHRMDLHDDMFPSLYPRFGIAEHSAYLGGEVAMEKDTSYHIPIINDWDDIDKLHVDENNKWYRCVIDGMDYIQKKGEGKIALRLRGGACPADLANMIRGNDLFMDFYDDPEEVHRLIAKCTETENWFMQQQMKHNPGFCGGIVDGNGFWMPKNHFGHLSEDWSYMCSPAMYDEFGKPYTEKLIAPYDGVMMHVHGGGAHILPAVASMEKVKYIQIVQDPNQASPVDIYKKYEKELEGKVIALWMNWDEVEPNLDFFRGKRVILQLHLPTFDQAKHLVEVVHEQLPIRKKD